jgi:hypothetical protein
VRLCVEREPPVDEGVLLREGGEPVQVVAGQRLVHVDEPRHDLRMLSGQEQRWEGAHVVADHDGTFQAELAREPQDVGGDRPTVIAGVGFVALAIAPDVERQHRVPTGEKRHQLAPVVGRSQPAVDEQDRRTRAGGGEMQVHAVDEELAVPDAERVVGPVAWVI